MVDVVEGFQVGERVDFPECSGEEGGLFPDRSECSDQTPEEVRIGDNRMARRVQKGD